MSICLAIMGMIGLLLGQASCQKDDSAAPVVTRVRTVSKDSLFLNVVTRTTLDDSLVSDMVKSVAFDSTVTSGQLNRLYAIMGEHLSTTTQVMFNGLSAYFNPALVTDNSIIITIPPETPWGQGQPDRLTVVTRHGVAEVVFAIQQPPPVISGIAPLAGSPGEVVTIRGNNFVGLSSVTFDGVEATIVGTPTDTEIQVLIPADIVQAYIYVTTAGGTIRSPMAFGFRYVVYDDALASGWWVGGWNGGDQPDFSSTAQVKRGAHAIAVTYQGGYAGFQIGNGGGNISLADMSAIKLSIYGGAGSVTGNVLRINVMGPDSSGAPATGEEEGVVVSLVPGEWVDITIPLTEFGTRPVILEQIRIQELSGHAPQTIYIDDIGFI